MPVEGSREWNFLHKGTRESCGVMKRFMSCDGKKQDGKKHSLKTNCVFLPEQVGLYTKKGEFGAGGTTVLYICFGGDYMAVTHRTIHKKW